MKPQGIFELPLAISRTWLHFGQKGGQDFAQFSFPDLGAMNGEVEKAAITENTVDVTIDINGIPMTIHLEQKDGTWSGHMSLKSISLEQDFQGTLLSSDPDFQAEHYVVPEGNLEILRTHDRYESHPCEGRLEYELHNPEVLAYLPGKGISVPNRQDFATAKALMAQLCGLIAQDGVNYCHDVNHRGTIAQIEFALNQDSKTNCRGVALILSGILRAYGFRANIVECWPIPSDQSDIHVVCEVYCPDLGKTVLMDPSSNLIYYLDGTPLSLIELRRALCGGRAQDITINEDAHHGENPVNKAEMLAYMSKNLVVLAKAFRSSEQEEMTDGNCLVLLPLDFQEDRFAKWNAAYTHNLQEFYTTKP